MLLMRSIGTIGALLLLMLTQSGLAYSATATICSTSIPGSLDRHCCMEGHSATSPSDQCRAMCELESKDIPVTPRTAAVKTYVTDAAFDLTLGVEMPDEDDMACKLLCQSLEPHHSLLRLGRSFDALNHRD